MSNQSFNDRVHFQTQGCKFNDSYSQNDSIVKFCLPIHERGTIPNRKTITASMRVHTVLQKTP